MHITIRQLQIIEAIVQTHSYSLAAERLYMTQPAISMQMKQLEHNIDVKLFERQGKRIVLSSAGQDIYPQIERLIADYNDLIERVFMRLRIYTRGGLKFLRQRLQITLSPK